MDQASYHFHLSWHELLVRGFYLLGTDSGLHLLCSFQAVLSRFISEWSLVLKLTLVVRTPRSDSRFAWSLPYYYEDSWNLTGQFWSLAGCPRSEWSHGSIHEPKNVPKQYQEVEKRTFSSILPFCRNSLLIVWYLPSSALFLTCTFRGDHLRLQGLTSACFHAICSHCSEDCWDHCFFSDQALDQTVTTGGASPVSPLNSCLDIDLH